MKTVFYFTAEWCQPCKTVRPIVEQLNRDQSTAIFQIIDVDDNEELAKQFKITSIPTFILFENYTEKDRLIGSHTRNSLESFINE